VAPKRGLTPEAVVDAAAAIADADGLDAVTVARVAESLDVRAPSLYAHVDGLDGIRRALALRGARLLSRELRSAAAEDVDPDTDVVAIGHAYRRFAHEHPGLYAAAQVAMPQPGSDQELADALADALEPVIATVAALGLYGDDAIHAIRAMRATLHGFVVLERDGGFGLPQDVDESFDRMLRTHVRSITTARAGA
jgi:AcrR family transcriptional regulator